MDPSEYHTDELELQLEELHAASFGWACSCCGWNEADAEDVLQTVYMKVISGRARFQGQSAFKTWLFGVIRLTASELARSVRSAERKVTMLAVEARGSSIEVERPDESVEKAERSRLLKDALDALPDRQREVMNLVFYQDLTLREAAEVMEVSIGSVRVHYDRGKKKLRALLEGRRGSGGRL
jgi:RNA polymerase sigma-70 factor (ECF subfamily)